MKSELAKLIEDIEKATGPDWRLDEQVIEALGGHIRRVSRLGLTGRTPGSYRAFFDHSHPIKGSAIPKYTKTPESRQRIIKRLRALDKERQT